MWRSLVIVCLTTIGCSVQSEFRLAEQSRLPKWFASYEQERQKGAVVDLTVYTDSTVSMEMYWPADTTILFWPRRGDSIARVNGDLRLHPREESSRIPGGGFFSTPRYWVVTIDGVVEVLDLPEREPVFSITDDEALVQQAIDQQ